MARRRQNYVLHKAAEVEAVVSPLRHHLLRTLGSVGPCSVKELGLQMGRSAESLYYHVRALEKVGLIEDRGQGNAQGRPETIYATKARRLLTDPTQTTPAYLQAYGRSVAALVRLAGRQIGSAIQRQAEARSRRSLSLCTMQVQARLSPASQRELARRVAELLDFVTDSDDPSQSERVAVTLLSAPLDRERP